MYECGSLLSKADADRKADPDGGTPSSGISTSNSVRGAAQSATDSNGCAVVTVEKRLSGGGWTSTHNGMPAERADLFALTRNPGILAPSECR